MMFFCFYSHLSCFYDEMEVLLRYRVAAFRRAKRFLLRPVRSQAPVLPITIRIKKDKNIYF